MAGIYTSALFRWRLKNFNLTIYERNPVPTGTWWENKVGNWGAGREVETCLLGERVLTPPVTVSPFRRQYPGVRLVFFKSCPASFDSKLAF